MFERIYKLMIKIYLVFVLVEETVFYTTKFLKANVIKYFSKRVKSKIIQAIVLRSKEIISNLNIVFPFDLSN